MDQAYPPPSVNIYLPTYDPDPNHLKEAVRSVLRQTYADWILLIRDDYSSHDVNNIIQEFLSDPRITFIRGEKNLGIGGSWNACLEHGNAPFVQYLFQDDLWAPQYLEKTVHAMESNISAGMVAVEHDYLFEGEIAAKEKYLDLQRFKEEHLLEDTENGREFLAWWMERGLHPNVIGEPSFVMLRREVTNETGRFKEDMPQFLDVDYWVRCLLVTDCYFLRENLGSFRVHGKAASAQNEFSGSGIYDRLRCFEELIDILPRGELRKKAVRSRNKALDGMAQKFFGRLKNNEAVPVNGSGNVRSFALRHPFLMMKAAWRGWRMHRADSMS